MFRERRWKKGVNQVVRALRQLALTDRVLLPSFLTPGCRTKKKEGRTPNVRCIRRCNGGRSCYINSALITRTHYHSRSCRVCINYSCLYRLRARGASRARYSIFRFIAAAL